MSLRHPGTPWHLVGFLLGLAAVLFLSGCAANPAAGVLTRQIQNQRSTAFEIAPGGALGQTFTAGLDGLQEITVYINSALPPQGQIVLRLFSVAAQPEPFGSLASGPVLAETALDLSAIALPDYAVFQFTPIPDSAHQSYFLELLLDAPPGSLLQISAGPPDSYLDGALYFNGKPEDSQLAFGLGYSPTRAAMGYLQDLFIGLGWIGLGMLLALLPGWVLLDLLPHWLRPVDFTIRLGLAGGVGITLYSLLMLWSRTAGQKPAALLAWIPMLAAALYLLFRRKPPDIRLDLPGSLAIVLLIIISVARAAAVRGLAAPLWGDSYQHSLITRLLLDHGGLFQSWEPYVPLSTFTYHFGFHSFAAALSWISGLPAPEAVLWAGQAAGVLAVLALAPLAEKVGRTPWAAPSALLITGLLSPMPAFYTNWGRYTQLAGQVILPAFVWLCFSLLEEAPEPGEGAGSRWRTTLLLALAAAGLALAHVRITILATLYPIAHGMLRLRRPGTLHRTGWLAAAGLAAFLLYLPWFVNVFSSRLADMFIEQVSTPLSQVRPVIGEINTAGSLDQFLPAWLWLLLLASILWAAWRRRQAAAPLILWLILAVLAANPQWLNLPGAAVLGAFTAYLAAYIPLGILAGAMLGSLLHWLENRRAHAAGNRLAALRAALVLFLLIAAGAGFLSRIRDIQPDRFALVTNPDLRAAAWVSTSLPPQARLLVNAFPAFYGASVVGADSGWWLPLLAQRSTTLPPLNYSLEAEPYPGYRQSVNHLVSSIQQRGMDDSQVRDALSRQEVTHVFIGQRQGSLNNPYPPLLDPAVLMASPYYRLLYHQDRVWVFEVLP